MPVDPIRLKDIFSEALARADRSDRVAYLEAACGDDAELRSRVEALLRAGEEPDSLLDAPPPHGPADATITSGSDARRPVSLVTADFGPDGATSTFDGTTRREHPPATTLGTVIAGRYTLVEVIGEGGMGSVYLADQSEPVKRQVALKLIKTGMDSRGVLARFNAERQALALMDHPNIARIYDGGVTATRQPFFVMELVNGVPLTDYCDARRLTVDARLQLFVAVCQAVQHAHQKGIIHRDLKPGNVLVTEVDGRPTPKVIDFGVAKATELKLTDMSFADAGAIVGTPAYMSPEQADPSSMDIDTRTDVYALGVILYELLTGAPPIDASQFKRGAVLEMLRMVREVDPPRPSTRLSEADAGPNIAASRSIEPAKLAKLLQGELDWVVMKALEKDRTRRYETANGFAADILRYLADEVVEARPPSRGYRLKKFVRRNKGQVIAASLVLVALLGGIMGTTLGLIAAKNQEQIARDETAEKEKARAAEAERVTERDHALGMQREALMREAERADELKHRLGVSQVVLAAAAYDNRDVVLAAERLDKVPADQRGWDWHYLKQQTRGGLFTLHGHTMPVTCVAYSPDGTRIVTGAGMQGTASEVRVLDARTGGLLLDLKGVAIPGGVNTPVTSVAFSPDGTRLVTGGGEALVTGGGKANVSGEAKVWDARTGASLLELKQFTFPVYRAVFSPDGTRIATACGDGMVKVWDARTGAVLLELKGHRYGVTSVAFSPDGTRIASAGHDQTLKVWDSAKGGEALLDVPGITSGECTVAFSPDGTRVVTGRRDATATVIDARTGAVQLELKGRSRGLDANPDSQMGVLSAAFSPDGTRIVTAGGIRRVGGEVTVWDARTGVSLIDLTGHTDKVVSAAFSPDGTHVVTGSCDRTAKVWDARTGSARLELGRDRDDVLAVAFSLDGTRLVTGSGDRTVKVWDARTGQAVVGLKGFKGTVKCAAFSPDGTRVVTGGVAAATGEATIWDARTGMPLVELKGFREGVNSVAFSPDGTRVVTGAVQVRTAGGTEVKVWDARTGAVLLDLTEPVTDPYRGILENMKGVSASFSPDGTRILVAGVRGEKRGGRRVKVCDARTGAILVELEGKVEAVLSAAFSPDGTRIVAGGWGVGKVWDSRAGTLLLELKGHTGHLNDVAFSPDGTRIVTASGDRTVKVWDARTGTALLELRGHAGFVTSVAFSPDGTQIAAGGCGAAGKPGEVIVWDARVPKPGLVLEGGLTRVSYATFSPDGTRVVACDRDGTLKVWDARAGTVLFELKLRPEALMYVTFSRDGTRLVTTGASAAVVWDARTGKELPGEAVPEWAPVGPVSPDGRFLVRVDGNSVEVSPVEPDPDELAYRRLHTGPDPWRYRDGYLAARAAKDAFAAKFYLDLVPSAGRAALVSTADLNALAVLSERASQHEQTDEWDKALPLLVEIMNVTKAKLDAESPVALEAALRVGRAYRELGRYDKAVPLYEAVLKVRVAKLGRDHIDTLTAALDFGRLNIDADRVAEAIPPLEESYRAAKTHPVHMRRAAEYLIEAYAKAGDHGKRVRLIQAQLADARKTMPPDSLELGAKLYESAALLLQSKAFYGAEPLLRECLVIYDQRMPDAWPTFHARSQLGEALSSQKKYAAAEPLLLAGYEGMKQREKTIPTYGDHELRIPQALDRLIEFYTATEKPSEAKKWQAERATYPPPRPPMPVAPPPREKK
jgi:WD40 repeat protein/serine/threonine protein kinase/tetratricopeptide (TPR) repeat protein